MREKVFFAAGAAFGIFVLVTAVFFAAPPTEAKVVTTKNGTKLYCYKNERGENYHLKYIENAQEELIIPETVDGKHKIDTIWLDGMTKYKEVRRVHFPSGIRDLYGYNDDEDYDHNPLEVLPNLTEVSFSRGNPVFSAKDGKVYYKKKELEAIAPGISHVTIESEVKTISPCALSDLVKLEEFSVDKANRKYKSKDGVLYSKDGSKLIAYPMAKKDKVFSVPKGVKTIRKWAGYGQKNLQEIKMSSTVRQIGWYSFAWCSRLEKVSLNKKIEKVKEGAFWKKHVTIYAYESSKAYQKLSERAKKDLEKYKYHINVKAVDEAEKGD